VLRDVEPGRALDTFIAEKLMGWKYEEGQPMGVRISPLTGNVTKVPPYSTNGYQAMKVVDVLRWIEDEMTAFGVCKVAVDVIEKQARGK
jgi:hypothetical protein